MKLGPNGLLYGSLWDLDDLCMCFDYELTATNTKGSAIVTIKNFSLNYTIRATKGDGNRL